MKFSLHISLALLSVALLAYQLLLMQVLSFLQWLHVASMIISVALLGFGASGTIIALARGWFLRHAEVLIPGAMSLSGATMAAVLPISQLDAFRFDSHVLVSDPAHLSALVATCALLTVPFFCGALALGLVFIRDIDRIGSLYFANLLGSGLGGAAAIGLSWMMRPEQAVFVVALLPVAASFGCTTSGRRGLSMVAGAIAGGICIVLLVRPPLLHPSQYKDFSRTMNLPESQVILESHSPFGILHVVASPALRYAPGLSTAFQDPVPPQRAVFNNGDWIGPLIRRPTAPALHVLDCTTAGLPYAICKPERVLVLQARTGADVAHALSHRARKVTAVESHAALVGSLRGQLAGFTDSLLFDTAVDLHVMDPRAYLRTDTTCYDLIVLPTLGAFGGTVGLYALQEQYLLTEEAFREIWSRLTPDGAVCISAWIDYPLRNPLRALATLTAACSIGGSPRELEQHLAAVRSWSTITYLLQRARLTPQQVERTRTFAASMFFDPLLLPGLASEERARFNQSGDTSFFTSIDAVLSPARDQFMDAYLFDIRPTTDDRPYFSQFFRVRALPRLREAFGTFSFPFLELASLLIAVTFIATLVLTCLVIVVPLLMFDRSGMKKARSVTYFGALGAGYILIEMAILQRCVLFLGHPLYAAAGAIGAMLISSGVGSYVSGRLPSRPDTVRRVGLLVMACIVLYAGALQPTLQLVLPWPLVGKAAVLGVIIAPLAFLMGMLFPLGMRLLSARTSGQTAWAWGVNGCLSVVGAPLALVISISSGYVSVMLCAALLYAVAAMTTASAS